jgi:carbon starvation protein
VGYGAMLLEGFVALIALATVMIAAPAPGAPPGDVYAQGIARCVTVLTGDGALLFATTFGAMAFSTFVFDTLDVATRLGRYLLQELTGWTGRAGAALATGLTVGVPLLWLLAAGKDGYKSCWVLFGTSNQLLAALTLMGVSVWLVKQGKRCWYTVAPMVFLFAITFWSLGCQMVMFWRRRTLPDGTTQPVMWVNLVVAIALAALAVYLLGEARRALRRPAQAAGGGAA